MKSAMLEEGQMLRVQQGEARVNVYRRSEEEIARAKKHEGSKFDTKYPPWWPQEKYPLKYISLAERSMVPKYFVFYDWSPLNGVVTLINRDWYDESEDLTYLGIDWVPGFIDYDNQVYYDTTGRPMKWGPRSDGMELSKVPLLIPPHEYDELTGSVKLLCH
ncbi:hypothetical protein [Enterovibrio norvegicus]|uniref:hypothetical protein n=1 Tax=Enterovibrio norvegicus TaxID=188144 RepID=UPI0024B1488E|nr:hypothetical protein [Enterovibrio norvegicus]